MKTAHEYTAEALTEWRGKNRIPRTLDQHVEAAIDAAITDAAARAAIEMTGHLLAAEAKEREACAKVAETIGGVETNWGMAQLAIAKAIRARSEK